ncbi:MlaD family protein [Aestuariirhabdus sp. Z084]|uniref:PqiB family protein n=1 Tax=Aestuariirhabdus haliotis TaxID=2918751 RepID=UPI00201B3C0E|nr:MlaD family protein [Aestuariirhabdus haliotis]MCL6414501.1 MlaD family protein [Aestuariirhabdus haliotis]MCL6418517.1 MlaD family protein [Aestuariirhabdus haliotis]
MTEPQDHSIPEAISEPPRGISVIWLVPFIAALIGGWLLYKGIKEAPTTIVIQFPSATGIIADRTPVMLQGLAIGKVAKMRIAQDSQGVDVEVAIQPDAVKYITEDAKFWLVKPEVSLEGVTGLETILSGNHISMSAGSLDKKQQLNFKALSSPPSLANDAEGLHFMLRTEHPKSIAIGTPIYFKKIQVGYIVSYRLDAEGKGVDVRAFIEEKHAHLVKKTSRFWNASGVHFRGNLSGFKIEVESLMSLLSGGLAFYTPETDIESELADDWDEFALFDNFDDAEAGIPIRLEFASGRDLVEGQTQVIYEGLTIGIVRTVTVKPDLTGVWAEVMVDPRAEPALVEGARFWLVKPEIGIGGIKGIDALIKGNYINMDFNNVNSATELQNRAPKRDFIGLDHRPPKEMEESGLTLYLQADNLGSLTVGSPVSFRQIPVGTVEDFTLNKNNDGVVVNVYIQEHYAHLVTSNSKFWNTSGISISGGLTGLKLETESLSSLIAGGLSFDSPESTNAQPAKDGDQFKLFANRSATIDKGPFISITFDNGTGLKEGTEIRFNGIRIGSVIGVDLNTDMQNVKVSAQLNSSAQALAREGSVFWVVKPQLGLAKTANLGTLISGYYIEVRPSKTPGRFSNSFEGLSNPPFSAPVSRGLNITLVTPRKGSLKKGSLVSYRDIPVGKVTGFKLAEFADAVHILVNIEEPYRSLIKENTRFWNASGIDVNFGLFKGASIKTESLESILAGGITFATPDNVNMGEQVTEGARFQLFPQAQTSWLDWAPQIPLEPAP